MSTPELQTDGVETGVDEKPHWPSPGQKLMKIREELGLSHSRVADALHMTAHYVKALENDEYDKLPGKTFIKGYIRSYAKLLNTDVDEVMRCYEQYVAALEENEESEANVIRAKKAYDQNIRWTICAALIIVLVVSLSYWLSTRDDSLASVEDNQTTTTGMVNPEFAGEKDAVMMDPLPMEEAEVILEDAPTANKLVQEITLNPATLDPQNSLPQASDQPIETEIPVGNDSPGDREEAGEPEYDSTVSLIGGQDKVQGTQRDTVVVESSIEANNDRNTVPVSTPDYTVVLDNNRRKVSLESEGNDYLEVHFIGKSWIEVDNASNTRLFHDMLDTGDDLTIRGNAPFYILIGDATKVAVSFNNQEVDVSPRIRSDNSARITLEPEEL